MSCPSLPFSYFGMAGMDGLTVVIGELLEKAGRYDDALMWAEKSRLVDVTKGGNLGVPKRAKGLRLQGRCLAAKGQLAEAEAALSSAAEQQASIEWWLGEILALRDLLVCVLRKVLSLINISEPTRPY